MHPGVYRTEEDCTKCLQLPALMDCRFVSTQLRGESPWFGRGRDCPHAGAGRRPTQNYMYHVRAHTIAPSSLAAGVRLEQALFAPHSDKFSDTEPLAT